MKNTSKQKIINESIKSKLENARQLKQQGHIQEAIEMYGKVLFLKQQPEYLLELANTYELLMDLSTAASLYKRVNQLRPKPQLKDKIKELYKIIGIQLLYNGSFKNILADTEFQIFIKRYHAFHQKMMSKIATSPKISQHLICCLAFLEVNYLNNALDEVDSCLIIDDKDMDLKILKGMICWSMMEPGKGYQQFWQAYMLEKNNQEIQNFLEMMMPKVQALYKQAKYDLIQKKIDKCRIKVRKGLEMHPYHTNFLILSSYLHRTSQKFESAIIDLQLAKKTLEDKSIEIELKHQFSLTYNQMGVYLYNQGKYYQSIDLFNEALTYKQKDWAVYANRGDCYRSINDYAKALDDYLSAFSIQNKNEDLRFRIASIYNIQGINEFNNRNFQNALKQFSECIKYSGRCSQFHVSKAKCLIQLNRRKEAVVSLQEALTIEPNLVEAIQLLQQHRQPDEKKSKYTRKVINLSKQK